eukprot:UN29094
MTESDIEDNLDEKVPEVPKFVAKKSSQDSEHVIKITNVDEEAENVKESQKPFDFREDFWMKLPDCTDGISDEETRIRIKKEIKKMKIYEPITRMNSNNDVSDIVKQLQIEPKKLVGHIDMRKITTNKPSRFVQKEIQKKNVSTFIKPPPRRKLNSRVIIKKRKLSIPENAFKIPNKK